MRRAAVLLQPNRTLSRPLHPVVLVHATLSPARAVELGEAGSVLAPPDAFSLSAQLSVAPAVTIHTKERRVFSREHLSHLERALGEAVDEAVGPGSAVRIERRGQALTAEERHDPDLILGAMVGQSWLVTLARDGEQSTTPLNDGRPLAPAGTSAQSSLRLSYAYLVGGLAVVAGVFMLFPH
jgi:hypothetical protein